ncbi:c-type cytochrome [Phragmitibacter flavus]|uniref:C-type cytochrome n=1 Tax=Phragmitibacter flavus TaxID=2576071 RepID=A0A5R8KI20_9BACT|nr:c-type cytochrome [Phragmitibacter flavus]TLD71958.1 c-type cytochrome [Phragmitibacter flavus]
MSRLLSLLPLLLTLFSPFLQAQPPTPAANDEVRKVMETFKGRGVMRGETPPTPPDAAPDSFQLRDGLALDLMAAEPMVEQPLYLSWDSRGRLWVTLYRQYQFPAGLKITSYDQHLRAVFDTIPQPPPHGVKGADQVIVLEDTNHDGQFDSRKVVIDGLNIATAAIKGAGGIWVLNPPYLLFYPDANHDDIPDSDPEVALSGFGLEDTHAVANSLQFGPDGWLYGVNGSTTTCNISSRVTKNIRFEGQHVWRFHPKTHRFEVYAEGGGNTFNLEIDSNGRFFSGTNGNARGIHYDQGMSGIKNFGKHGPAGNPYAFGYFDHLETKSDGKRFSQAFCIYEGGDPTLTKLLGNRIIAPNSLHNFVYVSRLIPTGSTFRVEDDAPLLKSTDSWFRPVDIKVGPDGGIWMADWYDTRLSHVSPVDDWHKTSGRIYRVRANTEPSPSKPFNLHTSPAADLVKLLNHPNKWFRRQAGFELAWRNATEVLPDLEKHLRSPNHPHAIDSLFALHMLGGLRDELALDLLVHPNPSRRRWVIRCIGDTNQTSPRIATAIRELALREDHPEVRTQLLCSLKRLPASNALPALRVMLTRDQDLTDPRIPLLLWWALEDKAETDREPLLALFDESAVWHSQLAQSYAIKNLARRWALAGGTDNFNACAGLLRRAPRDTDRTLVIEGIASAFQGSKMPVLPPALAEPLQAHLKKLVEDDLLLAVKTGDKTAIKKSLAVITDQKAPTEKRIALLEALAAANHPDLPKILQSLLKSPGNLPLKHAALNAAGRYDDLELARTVLTGYEARFAGDPALRDAAHRMLASRKESSTLFLDQLDARTIKPTEVAVDVVNQMRVYNDESLTIRLDKHWPPVTTLLAADQATEMTRIKTILTAQPGNPKQGHLIYQQRCHACHKLFNEGGLAGPDLTGYERSNLDFWLTAILAPNAEIREGFGTYIAKQKNGQMLMGMLEKQDATGILLRDMAGQKHLISNNDIETLDASPVSLMPAGLIQGLSDEDLRHLFAYLMKP